VIIERITSEVWGLKNGRMESFTEGEGRRGWDV